MKLKKFLKKLNSNNILGSSIQFSPQDKGFMLKTALNTYDLTFKEDITIFQKENWKSGFEMYLEEI